MVDVSLINIKAGKGGDGSASFRREKYIARGGPDGGDGGNGGDVYLVGDKNLRTLDYFAGKQRFGAKPGKDGAKRKQHGHNALDLEIKVPLGTAIWESPTKKMSWALELLKNKRSVSPANHAKDLQLLGEITKQGQRLKVAKGGFGGRGNDRFKSSTNQTPTEGKPGGRGEEKWLMLELKLLADVGFVGLPNVGKSTLLSVLTAARPKIADYEFTTLEPNLGVLKLDSRFMNQDSSLPHELVLADIPGLIEGASEGKGLGDEFLRHVERCSLLVHVVSPKVQVDSKELLEMVVKGMRSDFETINKELADYHSVLGEKEQVVVVNKVDMIDETLMGDLEKKLEKAGFDKVLFASAATSKGLDELVAEFV